MKTKAAGKRISSPFIDHRGVVVLIILRLAAAQPLENFVEANYTVEDTKDFYLETVRLLRKK